MKNLLFLSLLLTPTIFAGECQVLLHKNGVTLNTEKVIACSSSTPCELTVKVLKTKLLIKSQLLGDLICNEQVDGVHFSCDYSKVNELKTDTISVSNAESPQTTLATVQVIPIRVSFSSRSMTIKNTTWMNDRGATTVSYSVQPWIDGLKNHISFVLFPTLQGTGTFSLDATVPSARSGSISVKCDAEDSSVSGITALLSDGTECASRQTLHFGYQSLQLALSQPTQEEREQIKAALSEKFKTEEDPQKLESVKRLRGILMVHRVPYVTQAIAEMPAKELLIGGQSGLGGLKSFILDFTAYCLKFAPTPSLKR